MVDLFVGQYRYDGTTCAPGEQSPAVPGGASSRAIEVARRKRAKLTPSDNFVGALAADMEADSGPIEILLLLR